MCILPVSFIMFNSLFTLREDTHKKVFFSGRTTKGVGRVTPPPRPLSKKPSPAF